MAAIDSEVDTDDFEIFDLEIVGLDMSSNGRSCTVHAACGQTLQVGDIVRLVKTIVAVEGVMEDAVKAVRVSDGVDGCTVGFVPFALIETDLVRNNLDKFGIVRFLYKESSNSYQRRKSYQNYGMAGISLLSEIPKNE